MNDGNPAPPRSILLSTLGTTWAVVAEAYGFLAPGVVDLYRYHKLGTRLNDLRHRLGMAPPSELWVVTTESADTRDPLKRLAEWWSGLRPNARPALRIWQVESLADADDQEECARMREAIFRVCLRASEEAPGRLTLCLAGGRKTMSADLQSAGSFFGASTLLHVIAPTPLPDHLRVLRPGDLLAPLPAEVVKDVTPVVVGRGGRADYLAYPRDGGRPVVASEFPVPLPSPEAVPLTWGLPEEGASWLTHEIDARRREASQLLGNYLGALSRDEKLENWRTLYRLPVESIGFLQKTMVGPQHLEWLRKLPKADLHHHLGGTLDVPAQVRVGRAVWAGLTEGRRSNALKVVEPLLGARWDEPWGFDWGRGWADDARSDNAAALLANMDPKLLERNLFACTEPRRALKSRDPHTFGYYPRPGDLMGSTLLQEESAIGPYAREAVAAARRQGIRLLELRGSPHKYLRGDGMRFLSLFARAVREEVDRDQDSPIEVRFIVILNRSRERMDVPEQVVELALKAREKLGGFVAGIDLAGDEKRGAAEELAPGFARAFEECFPVTIHAGEGESAANIWKAAYVLHADRVGHGLTLAERPELAPKFRFRRICLELCPTSNLEVVGYEDPDDPSSRSRGKYPLRDLLDLGIPVTLCTDNPGISQTELAAEFVTASRLVGGLTLWEALGILKAGFLHAFLPPDVRDELVRNLDVELFRRLSAGLPPA